MPDERGKLELPLSAEEVELLWALCYAVVAKTVSVHADFLPLAGRLEPLLYRTLTDMVPGFQHTTKMVKN